MISLSALGRPALLGVTLLASLSTHAMIIDLGTITRDTDTGFDWLDLTETSGRSFLNISAKFGLGEEFYGWRYASLAEVKEFWQHLGVTKSGSIITPDPEYDAIEAAIALLGNTFAYGHSVIQLGAQGITGTPSSRANFAGGGTWSNPTPYRYHFGYHDYGTDDTFRGGFSYDLPADDNRATDGSYLVRAATAPVPIPATAWLFGSAILGLGALRRK